MDTIAQQPVEGVRETRAEIPEPTPVFGTAQPLRGASGLMRRAAYAVPEHRARHWLMLMGADRVDVLEDRLGTLLAAPMERAGMEKVAKRVRANPLMVLGGALLGVFIARRLV